MLAWYVYERLFVLSAAVFIAVCLLMVLQHVDGRRMRLACDAGKGPRRVCSDTFQGEHTERGNAKYENETET